MRYVIKKDKTVEPYDDQKVINAVTKSAQRALETLTEEDYRIICNEVFFDLAENDYTVDDGSEDEFIPVEDIHAAVENTLLDLYPNIGRQYQQYRNYKLDFCHMLDDVYTKSQGIRYIGDVSNANTDSTMISTQRSLIYGQLNKNLYQKFFLNKEENQACNDGYIYIHDMKDRLDGINCCLFDMSNVLKGGFEMGNVWYNEPKTVDTACDVLGDIIMSMASQEYGGYTVAEIDKVLAPYCEKSYRKHKQDSKSKKEV